MFLKYDNMSGMMIFHCFDKRVHEKFVTFISANTLQMVTCTPTFHIYLCTIFQFMLVSITGSIESVIVLND